MPFLGDITFLNPWLLVTLTALPVLWLILRITPTAPRRVELPTLRFLEGLIAERHVSSRTPWWLLLLRLLILACLIVAFAHPVQKISSVSLPPENIRLVFDNGWESATNWETQIRAGQEILTRADNSEKDHKIYIVTTAPAPGDTRPFYAGPVSIAEARGILKNLEPLPWPSDYKAAAKILEEQQRLDNAASFWFSAGLSNDAFQKLSSTLSAQGKLDFYEPGNAHLPALIGEPEMKEQNLIVPIKIPANTKSGKIFTAQLVSYKGNILDQQVASWDTALESLTASFKVPANILQEIGEARIAGQKGAGSLYKFEGGLAKRTVGILGGKQQSTKPFVEAQYYIERALQPYATIIHGTYESLLEQNPSVIILPTASAIPVGALNQLENWIKKGGLLLRFAGPDMSENNAEQTLLPVRVRSGDRSAGGALSWEKTGTLNSLSENSPLSNIKISDGIMVRRQILAETSADLADKTWASLDDGTPLITAQPLDKGLIVFIHTSPVPEWSDLGLSGSFVEILNRVVQLSGKKYDAHASAAKTLQPVWVLDGFGNVTKPPQTAQPVSAENIHKIQPNSYNPPGAYGHEQFQKTLNLGSSIKNIKGIETLPAGTNKVSYGQSHQQDFKTKFLLLAVCLFLLDWSILIIISRGFLVRNFACILIWIGFCMPSHAADFAKDAEYADGFYLAYVRTGDSNIDQKSQRGLQNLAQILQGRTSAEPRGVVDINLESDTLAFFPFLYWPIGPGQSDLSPVAARNIQTYLDNGGTILLDTQDGSEGAGGFGMSSNSQRLQRLLSRFNIPPLIPAPKDHVLMRSFYLLKETPGRYTDGALWIEGESAPGRDGVSSVIIGTYDWAGEWAEPRLSTQQEMSFRFGVNMVIYALTGNYKADQVHVSQILERLGQ